MFRPISTRMAAAILTGTLCWTTAAVAQPIQSEQNSATIIVVVDGLMCSSRGKGSFLATEFALAVTTGSGGVAGAGKTTFTDLVLLKPSDSCSLALLNLAAGAQIIKTVVVTEDNKGRGPSFSLTLENVQILRSSLSGSGSLDGMDERLDLSYGAITISDDSGHTTGRVVREPGSVPFSPFVKKASDFEM